MNKYNFEFYKSDKHGLIRVRSNETEHCHPEIIRDKKWIKGSEYVMDAVIGMGEDPYSCGEFALPITQDEASQIADKLGIDLFAENND